MQDIKNIRIDERLVHGQVATVWLRKLKVGRCIVIDDAAAANELERTMLRLSTPQDIKLSVLNVEKAAANLLAEKYDGQAVMIVVRSVQTLVALYKAGYHFKTFNVGNISGEQKVKRSVFLDKEDYDDFMYLHEQGVTMTALMVPDEENFDFMGALAKLQF